MNQKSTRYVLTLAASAFLAVAGNVSKGQTVPTATITSTQVLVPTVSGAPGHLASNSLGDIFYVATGSSTLYELPHNSTTPIAMETSLGAGLSVGVDSHNDVLISSPTQNRLVVIPYVTGSGYPASFVNSSTIPACPGAITAATVPCVPISNGGSLTGSSLKVADTAFDAAGNLYVINTGGGTGTCVSQSSQTCNQILKYGATVSRSTTPTVIAGGTVNPTLVRTVNAEIASDATAHLYYTDGTALYTITPGTSTGAVAAGGGFTTVTGVTIDALGNLYIVDKGSSRIVVYPSFNGVPQAGSAYTLAGVTALAGVAVDPSGRVIFASTSGSTTSISALVPWGANFGSVTVGSTSPTTTLNVYFNASATPSSIALSGPSVSGFSITGGTCATGTTYSAGSSCTVTVTFGPSAVGPQTGALAISGQSGVIATASLAGVGAGSAIAIDPGTPTALGSSWKTPNGIAVDNAGNVYVADSAANAVYRLTNGTGTPASLGTGLVNPTGVSVDGAGNLYIADSGNGRVVELPVVSGLPSTAGQRTVFPLGTPVGTSIGCGSSTNGPSNVATDYTGSLYITDSGNKRVLRLSNDFGTLDSGSCVTVGSGFLGPMGVAVDAKNNVYVADELSNAVYQFTLGSTIQQSISTSLSEPVGVAVDASGSVFVADLGNQRVVKIPSEAGQLNANDSISIAPTVAHPNAVALDASGNLYVTDATVASATQILRTQGLLDFGRVETGFSSVQLSAQVSNSGTAALVFGSPSFTQSGATASFSVDAPSSAGCVAATTLQSGFACLVNVTFAPTVTGNLVDTISFSTNASGTGQLVLSGTGTNLPHTQTSIAITNPASAQPVIGQAVTVQASVNPISSSSSSPTGTIQFVVDGQSSGQPIVVSGGTASLVVSGLRGGTHILTASYSGDNNFASSVSGPLSFTVGKTSTPVAFSIATPFGTPDDPPQSSAPNVTSAMTVSLTQAANVLPPSGTVVFYNNYGTSSQQQIGSAVAVSNLKGTANFTPTAAGTYNVTAVYSGDTNYSGSASSPVQVIVAPASYLLYPTSATVTIPAGGSGSVTLTVDEYSGINGAASVLCTSGVPAYTTCSPNPAEFSVNPARLRFRQPIVVTFQTDVLPKVPVPGVTASLRSNGHNVFLGFFLATPFAFALRRRKLTRKVRSVITAFAIVSAAAAGCLGLSSCSSRYLGQTPPGTYNVVITTIVNVGNVDYPQTANINLIVQ